MFRSIAQIYARGQVLVSENRAMGKIMLDAARQGELGHLSGASVFFRKKLSFRGD